MESTACDAVGTINNADVLQVFRYELKRWKKNWLDDGSTWKN